MSTFSQWAYDDPFITYRYADNLRRGMGFVYNPGERTLSTTSPLFAMLLAIFGSVWSDLPSLANMVGAVSLALGGLFLWDLSQTWETPIVGWTALFLYPTFPLLISTLGSEMPLYLASCLGIFAFYARQRYGLAGLFAGIAVLTRGGGILIPILLGLDYFWNRLGKRGFKDLWRGIIRGKTPIPWGGLFLFLSITLPWFLFAWLYFGSPFPATLATKQHQGAMEISQRFAPGALKVAGWYAPLWQYPIEACLALIGLIAALWRRSRWLLFFGWTVSYFVAYTALGVSSYFWYYAPLVPGFVCGVGLGIAWLSGLSDRYRNSRLPTGLTQAPIFIIVLVLTLAQGYHLLQIRENPDNRFEIYRAAGEWLRKNTSPNEEVGALEVGMIGYYAKRPMVDFAGLIQPEVVEQLGPQNTYEDAALWAMRRYRPQYLVIFQGAFPRLRQDYVKEQCHMVKQFPANQYRSSTDLQIYICGA